MALPRKDRLLPGEMSLSKDAIVKALAKPAVWGVGDKKRAVLLSLVTKRDTLLARVGESSQDLESLYTRLKSCAVCFIESSGTVSLAKLPVFSFLH
jgi:hypothetical protein